MSVETFNQDPSLAFIMGMDSTDRPAVVRISAIAAVTHTTPEGGAIVHLIGGDRITLRLSVSEVVTLIRADPSSNQATQQET